MGILIYHTTPKKIYKQCVSQIIAGLKNNYKCTNIVNYSVQHHTNNYLQYIDIESQGGNNNIEYD